MSIGRLSWGRQRARAHHLPDVATVVSNTAADDGQGGQADTWAEGASYPCRLVPDEDGREGEGAGRLEGRTPWRCYLPHDAAVHRSDLLRIAGALYQVVSLETAGSERVTRVARVVRYD